MRRTTILTMVIMVVGTGLLAGCASAPAGPTFQGKALPADLYVPRADHWVMVLDRSTSMADPYQGMKKLAVEQALVGAVNETLPEIGYEGGVVAFGKSSTVSGKCVHVLMKVQPYTTQGVGDALGRVGLAGGKSPLRCALRVAGKMLEGKSGTKAVVVFSDGLHMDGAEIANAGDLKKAFGDQGAVWAVQIGDSAQGRALLQQVVAAGGGELFTADGLTSEDALVAFVEKIFVARDSDGDGVADEEDACPDTPKGVKVDDRGCPLDTDGDGVPDYLDRCPDTPKGVRVDKDGCPLDSDGDGVPDYLDRCPDTPKGAPVDKDGCPLDSDGDGVPDYLDKCPDTPKGVPVDDAGCPPELITVHDDGTWEVKTQVFFDLNKAVIRDEAKPALDQLAEAMKSPRYAGWSVEVQGHCDKSGPRTFNERLSQKRADAVREYLVARGVAADRLVAKGYAWDRPRYPNDREHRALNRRVEFRPFKK